MGNLSHLLAGARSLLQVPPNIRGGYGFLTDYGGTVLTPDSPIDDTTARRRIQVMAEVYGVREFQFYDWFSSYSAVSPFLSGVWQNAWDHSYNIYESTIQVYIDEIHRHDGRAWAYVQSVGAEEYDLASDSLGIYRLIDGSGHWVMQPYP